MLRGWWAKRFASLNSKYLYSPFKMEFLYADKMTQQTNVHNVKPENLSLIPGICRVEGENQFSYAVV